MDFFNQLELLKNLFISGDYHECLELIENLKRISYNFDKTELTLLEVGCWTYLGIKHEKSVQLINEIIAKEPYNSHAFYGLGFNLYMNGKFLDCQQPLSRAYDLNPAFMQQALDYRNNAVKIFETIEDGKLKLGVRIVFYLNFTTFSSI